MMILNTLSEKKNQKVKGYLGWLKVNLMGQFMLENEKSLRIEIIKYSVCGALDSNKSNKVIVKKRFQRFRRVWPGKEGKGL